MDEVEKLQKELKAIETANKVKALKKKIKKAKKGTSESANKVKKYFAPRGNEKDVMDKLLSWKL